MIKESEIHAEADKAIKAKIDAKNSLENYLYQMRNSVEDKDKLAEKLSEEDKSKISDTVTDAQDWLNANGDSSSDTQPEEFEEKLKEVQSVCDPIISKVYKQTGGQGMADAQEDG